MKSRGPPGEVVSEAVRLLVEHDRAERRRKQQRRRRFLKDIETALIENSTLGAVAMARMAERSLAEMVVELVQPNLYGTFTFPPVFPEGLRRQRCRSFLGYYFRGGIWALAFEHHQKGDLHAHWVARDAVRRLSMMDAWTVSTGGYARIYAVSLQDQGRVSQYVAKYLTKEQADALEFGSGVQRIGGSDRVLDRLRPEGG